MVSSCARSLIISAIGGIPSNRCGTTTPFPVSIGRISSVKCRVSGCVRGRGERTSVGDIGSCPGSGCHIVVSSPLVVVSLYACDSICWKRCRIYARIRTLCRYCCESSGCRRSDIAGSPDLRIVSARPDDDIRRIATGVGRGTGSDSCGSDRDSYAVIGKLLSCDIGSSGVGRRIGGNRCCRHRQCLPSTVSTVSSDRSDGGSSCCRSIDSGDRCNSGYTRIGTRIAGRVSCTGVGDGDGCSCGDGSG